MRKLPAGRSALFFVFMLSLSIRQSTALDWRSQLKRKKRVAVKSGWKRTKKGWERLNVPPNSGLRIGVKYRPKQCPLTSKSGDFLSVHYNGTLYSDGSLFDSSILREEPFVFQIGKQQMNDGWERGLLNMCVGEKRKLIVPSDLAYGSTGGYGSEAFNKVKPGATIVYHIELLEILNEIQAAPHLVWGL